MATKLKSNQVLAAATQVLLPNGGMTAVEVITQGDSSFAVVVSTFKKGAAEPTTVRVCGYCSNELIACIDCPTADYTLDCIARTLTCD